ncbi:2'-5' RNA ligase family protein [Neorhizobium sp. DT-125]|uniref:2'-5' RNA ligase family protein n=1 Tax=Neorhizobium sp. DT-125 TaxID=3396163 RepID=UPI003F1D1B78
MSLRHAYSQSSLPFGEDWPAFQGRARPHPSKLFFCLKPTPFASRRMNRDAARHAGNRARRAAYPAELLHMTLLCMEQFDEPPRHLIPSIDAAIRRIRARPIRIDLDGSDLFGGKRHLVLTSSAVNRELRGFVRTLRNTLTRHNLPRFPLTSLEPHVTVIYDCGKIDPLPVEKPYGWVAEEFLLIYSHYGESRHEEFGRWRFDPDAPPYPSAPEQLRFLI